MSRNTPTEESSTVAPSISALAEASGETVVTTGKAIQSVITHPDIYSKLPSSFTFKDVLAFIDEHYDFTYTPFTVGKLENTDSGKTTGSCKVLAYAKLFGPSLSYIGVMDLFAEHYADVLSKPNDTNHPNIRALMQSGIDGVVFHGEYPLKLKK